MINTPNRHHRMIVGIFGAHVSTAFPGFIGGPVELYTVFGFGIYRRLIITTIIIMGQGRLGALVVDLF